MFRVQRAFPIIAELPVEVRRADLWISTVVKRCCLWQIG